MFAQGDLPEALRTQLPDLEILHQQEELKPYECDGLSAYRTTPMLVVLRDAQDRVVFNWIINPPVETLQPGQSADFRQAMVDVPRSASSAEIAWAKRR